MTPIKLFDRLPYGSSIKEKLEAYSMPVTETGCQIWLGYTILKGYGRMNLRGKQYLTHRLAYEEYIGIIPEGQLVLHRCDTPPCINPNHLFLGTTFDNRDDCVEKRRHAFGERHSFAKLTESDVSEIVKLLQSTDMSQREIAAEYDIRPQSLSSINRGKTWGYLTGLSPDNPAATYENARMG